MDFTSRRARALARLCAYSLLGIFLISLFAVALPLPFPDPTRTGAVLTEILERSTLPLVALIFLFFGMAEDALPALWECRFALRIRPLLMFIALFYVLIAIGTFGLAGQIQQTGQRELAEELRASEKRLVQLSKEIAAARDASTLRLLLDQQPELLSALQQKGVPLGELASLQEQRSAVAGLIDLAKVNLRGQNQQRRAAAEGNLSRQTFRLSLTALVYALFYAIAFILWPKSAMATIERILDSRRAAQADELNPPY